MNINGVSAGASGMIAARAVAPESVSRPASQASRPVQRPSAPAAADGDNDSPQDRAVFAVDKDHKVVIRILDKKGNLLMEVPPEQARTLQDKMGETFKNLYNREV